MNLNDDISKIKNLGPKRSNLFAKLNIFKIIDFLTYFPKNYEDRTNVKLIKDLCINQFNSFVAYLDDQPQNLNINSLTITTLKVCDKTSKIQIVWYNKPFLKKILKLDHKYMFYGKVLSKNNKLMIENPEFELISQNDSTNIAKIVPIYTTTFGITQNMLRKYIFYILKNYDLEFDEIIPDYILKKYNLCSKKFAILNIHFPESVDCFFIARKRLVFEELFFIQYCLLTIKKYMKETSNYPIIKDFYFGDILQNLNFDLTKAQNKVLSDIIEDLKNKRQINRLIQGDVGSGKTIIALILCYISSKNNLQSCIMVPTEVLAIQHYNYICDVLKNYDIKISLLTSSIKSKEKILIKQSIKEGLISIVVATHAVLQKDVIFKNLAFVITDEQHRFGVVQREIILKKGLHPHLLVMSATPIPRTLALTLYGDLDVSILDELPPGRQKIDTYVVNSSYRKRIYDFIENQIKLGKQIYIICPSILESSDKKFEDVVSYTLKLKNYFQNVACLHGKLKQNEKNIIFQDFLNNKISILVSTTVIEVGINVPNATVMVIENAEKFGLSTLHQLRGRVGRGNSKSYCILISDTKNPNTKQRLDALAKTNDGFEISELDLKFRGHGDFFGVRQHGLPDLKIANLYKDMEILDICKDAISDINTQNLDTKVLDKYTNNFFEKLNTKFTL